MSLFQPNKFQLPLGLSYYEILQGEHFSSFDDNKACKRYHASEFQNGFIPVLNSLRLNINEQYSNCKYIMIFNFDKTSFIKDGNFSSIVNTPYNDITGYFITWCSSNKKTFTINGKKVIVNDGDLYHFTLTDTLGIPKEDCGILCVFFV